MSGRPSIVVVGGGIAGLVAALESSRRSDVDVTLLEASERLGGRIGTIVEDGVLLESAADSFLARDDTALALCRELGLDSALVRPAVFGALLWSRGRLRRVPQGFPYGSAIR